MKRYLNFFVLFGITPSLNQAFEFLFVDLTCVFRNLNSCHQQLQLLNSTKGITKVPNPLFMSGDENKQMPVVRIEAVHQTTKLASVDSQSAKLLVASVAPLVGWKQRCNEVLLSLGRSDYVEDTTGLKPQVSL